ncbi:CAP_Gly-rich domain superfamily [Hexamita inflata]|uniref:CAP Gly-rich domain superfamily n=1 Tax=Hexamita inflata TaxID=28002 RepID=A0AA86RKL0_9EUKA|nr:CAP Gly-rich domain superfamily [Hexamita inflata]
MNLMTNIIRGFLDSQQQSLTSQLIMRGDNNFFTHFSAFKVITQQELQNDVHLNQIVFVNNQEALVKFIGTVHFGAGLFYGVEVPFGSGCTNGTELLVPRIVIELKIVLYCLILCYLFIYQSHCITINIKVANFSAHIPRTFICQNSNELIRY